ncbi:hypothetical protein [Halopseudomonas sp.]|uniref:hypothetical protein n=1 Tax=Halopseudomonas sp. TaxID=2901191 RepID=UPI00311F27C6
MKYLRTTISAAALATTLGSLPLTASASDIGFGVGISYIFGQGPAVGIKAFSDDDANTVVGAVGLDYVFSSSGLRPNIGVGYLGKGYYGDANLGYNLGDGGFDFGVGAGWSDADNKSNNRRNTSPDEPLEPPPQQQPG